MSGSQTRRAPTNEALFLGSLSSYPFEQHYFERPVRAGGGAVGLRGAASGIVECAQRADLSRDQLFRYAADGTAPKTEEVRGEQTVRSRRADPTPSVPAGWTPEQAPDPRESIRRRVIDRATLRDSLSRAAHEKEKEVLRFRVFLEESVPYSPVETRRTRAMQLWWYLEDDTGRIFEDHEDNSGLWQGTVVRRHALEKEDGALLSLEDVSEIGKRVKLYGKEYVVADADRYTRRWLSAHRGVELGAALALPATWHHPGTAGQHDTRRPTKVAWDAGFESNGALGFFSRAPDRRARFEAAYGQVLKFEVETDERERVGVLGDRMTGVLHYYLEDETMEILLSLGPNAGRPSSAKLLARQRVPRASFCAVASGASDASDATRGRVGFLTAEELARQAQREAELRRANPRYRYSQGAWSGTYRSPITGAPLGALPEASSATGTGAGATGWALSADGVPIAPVDHVTPDLLRVGREYRVLGRTVRVLRADPRTREWYATQLALVQTAAPHADGEADEEPAHGAAAGKAPAAASKVSAFERMYQQGGKVLRYRCRLEGPRTHPTDEGRRFILNFYLEDDSLMVYELPTANAGRVSGKFLERGAYRNARASTRGGARGEEEEDVAAKRSFGGAGELYGYGMGVGQGIYGGPYARADHVGAAGTGVAPVRGVGLERAAAAGAAAEAAAAVSAQDLFPGAELELDHVRGQWLVLEEPDAFTASWLRARAQGLPGPVLGVAAADAEAEAEAEAAGGEGRLGATLAGTTERLAPTVARDHVDRIALALAGCAASVRQHVRRSDAADSGRVPRSLLENALRTWGAREPRCLPGDVAALVDAHVVAAAPAPTAAGTVRAATTTAPLALDVAAWEEKRAGREPLVDYRAAFATLQERLELLPRLQARSDVLGDKIVRQLRSALLSSRQHFRRVFRELGRAVPGAITPDEFAGTLRRHHLDMGLERADVLAILRMFPPADARLGAPAGSVSWRGFLSHMTGHADLPRDDALQELVRIAGGMDDMLEGGAGHAPETFEHAPRPLRWKGDDADPAADLDRLERLARSSSSAPSRTTPSKVPPVRDEEEEEEEEDRSGALDVSTGSARDGADSPIVDTAPRAPPHAHDVLAALRTFFARRADRLRAVLDRFDPHRRGTLARASLVAAFEAAGFAMTLDEADALLSVAGPADKTGSVPYRPLVRALGVPL